MSIERCKERYPNSGFFTGEIGFVAGFFFPNPPGAIWSAYSPIIGGSVVPSAPEDKH